MTDRSFALSQTVDCGTNGFALTTDIPALSMDNNHADMRNSAAQQCRIKF